MNVLCPEYVIQQLTIQTCCEDSQDNQFLDYRRWILEFNGYQCHGVVLQSYFDLLLEEKKLKNGLYP